MWRKQGKTVNNKSVIEEFVSDIIKDVDCTDNVLDFEVYKIKCFTTYEQETLYSSEINQANLRKIIKYIIDKNDENIFIKVSRKNSTPYEEKKKGVQISYTAKSDKDVFGSKVFTQMNASSEYEINNMKNITPVLKIFLVFLLGLFVSDIVDAPVLSDIETVTYTRSKIKSKILFNSSDSINDGNLNDFTTSVKNVGMLSYGSEFTIHKFYK